MSTLKEELRDWCDLDGAAYCLAIALGLMTPDVNFSTRAKHVFWSTNPVGDALYRMIDEMVRAGVLERDAEDCIRWSPAFKGSWEKQT